MSDINLYKPSSNIVENSHVNHEVYEKMYEESIGVPTIGKSSRYRADANFTVLRLASAEVPPITTARW